MVRISTDLNSQQFLFTTHSTQETSLERLENLEPFPFVMKEESRVIESPVFIASFKFLIKLHDFLWDSRFPSSKDSVNISHEF